MTQSADTRPTIFLALDMIAADDRTQRGPISVAWATASDELPQWTILDPGFPIRPNMLQEARIYREAVAEHLPDRFFVSHHLAEAHPEAPIVTFAAQPEDLFRQLERNGHRVTALMPEWLKDPAHLSMASLAEVYQTYQLGQRQIPRVLEHLSALFKVHSLLRASR